MGQSSRERAGGGRQLRRCGHTHTVTTFIAGLARTVCESCGNVSIRYLGEGASWPEMQSEDYRDTTAPGGGEETAVTDGESPSTSPPRKPACKRCRASAYFITPWGLACSDHAWEAASRQDALSGDFWIPLLIDRSDVAD